MGKRYERPKLYQSRTKVSLTCSRGGEAEMVNLGTGRLLKGGGNGCDLIRVRFVSGSCQVWVGFVSSQMVDMGTEISECVREAMWPSGGRWEAKGVTREVWGGVGGVASQRWCE